MDIKLDVPTYGKVFSTAEPGFEIVICKNCGDALFIDEQGYFCWNCGRIPEEG